MQHEPAFLFVRVLVQMIDAVGIEEGSPPLDSVHDVALAEKEFGEVGAVLAGHTGDQGYFLRHAGVSTNLLDFPGGLYFELTMFHKPGSLDASSTAAGMSRRCI